MIRVVLISLFGLTFPLRGTPTQQLIHLGFAEVSSEDTQEGLRSRWLIRSRTSQLGGDACTNVDALKGETDRRISVGTSLSHGDLVEVIRKNPRCTSAAEDYFLCGTGAAHERVYVCDDMLLLDQRYETPGAREESCARALSIAAEEPGDARPKLCWSALRSNKRGG